MENYIKNKLLATYFPAFKNYEFKTSYIFGRIIDVNHKFSQGNIPTVRKKLLI